MFEAIDKLKKQYDLNNQKNKYTEVYEEIKNEITDINEKIHQCNESLTDFKKTVENRTTHGSQTFEYLRGQLVQNFCEGSKKTVRKTITDTIKKIEDKKEELAAISSQLETMIQNTENQLKELD